jgi:hypothetical protein
MSQWCKYGVVMTLLLSGTAWAAQSANGDSSASASGSSASSSTNAGASTTAGSGTTPAGTTNPAQPNYAPGAYPENMTARTPGGVPPVSGGAHRARPHKPGSRTTPNPNLSPQ